MAKMKGSAAEEREEREEVGGLRKISKVAKKLEDMPEHKKFSAGGSVTSGEAMKYGRNVARAMNQKKSGRGR